jgi:hypothetical protein
MEGRPQLHPVVRWTALDGELVFMIVCFPVMIRVFMGMRYFRIGIMVVIVSGLGAGMAMVVSMFERVIMIVLMVVLVVMLLAVVFMGMGMIMHVLMSMMVAVAMFSGGHDRFSFG